MTTGPDARTIRALLQDEIDGAHLYRTLADREESPEIAGVYRRLADAEERHAAVWRRRLEEAGGSPPTGPSRRARTLALLGRWLGAGVILPALRGDEGRAAAGYAGPGTAAMSADERSHARVLSALSGGPAGMPGPVIARIEGRHRGAGGNALRAAVLGANDGLLSNLGLVMGVAGADLTTDQILVTGVAGLLAGAGSMALGEWLSVQSARELYGHQIALEAEELRAHPEEERAELELIYRAKGLDPEAARALAARLTSDEAAALDTLAREELGVDPQELGGSAWVAAGTSFALFALGAVIPVVPFLVLDGGAAVIAALVASAAGLFGLGAAVTLMTGRNPWFSGLRQLGFGLAAAGFTYAVGTLVGAAL